MNLLKPPITAVLFDLGGTLFEHLESTTSDDNLAQALVELNARLSGLQVAALDLPTFVADYRRIRAEQELELLRTRFFLHQQLVSRSFELAVQEQLNEQLQEQLNAPSESRPGLHAIVSNAAASFCRRQCRSVTQDLRPQVDMHDTLQALQQRGLPMGIVSNIDEDYLQPLVAKHRLSDYFEFCLSSQVAQSCKPHQSIFAQALSILSAQEPDEVLFVGDSLAHDIAGAQLFGMRSAWLAPETTLAPLSIEHSPDYRIANLAALLTLVGV